MARKSGANPSFPFRSYNSSPEVIRLVVMMYVRFPLSLRNVEDLLFEHWIDLCHETVRMCTANKQEVGRWANNQVENSHLPFQRRERAMLRFRQTKTLQKFALVHANDHNHFNHECHLVVLPLQLQG